MSKIHYYNEDKPHRCPQCHAVMMEADLARRLFFRSATCCKCGAEVSRTPWIVLRRMGVVCTKHVCTCDGCWACPGHMHGCTCDVDWDELAERKLGL